MIEIPKPIHRPQPKGLQYKKDELFADYSYNYPLGFGRAKFSKVCDKFFALASKFMLKGGRLKTPLGTLFIVRIKHTRQYVDFGKLRNRDKHESIFRENNFLDTFEWDINLAMPYLRKYYFDASYKNDRSIPKFEEIRTLNIKADALQRSISQSSSGKSH